MKHKNSDKSKLFRQLLGEVIAEHRIKKNISQRLLADEYDISKNLLNRIERAQNDTQLGSFLTVSEAIGVPLEALIAEARKRLPEGFTVIDW